MTHLELSRYEMRQINSQKYIGPPKFYAAEEPADLTEIYISNLPTSVTIEEVFAMAFDFGTVYQVRLPVTYTEAKGYAYVRYIFEMNATNAIQHLDGCLFKGKTLKVVRSWDTRSLQILHWPVHLDEVWSEQIIKKHLKDVKSVRLEKDSTGANRGYIVVEFTSHNAAAIGRREIKTGKLSEDTRCAHTVTWTRSDFDIPEDDFRKVTDLYVGNIADNCTQAQVCEKIDACLGGKHPIKLNKGGFGFIYFPDHDSASRALEKLKGSFLNIDGQMLQFHWVKGKYAKKRRETTEKHEVEPLPSPGPVTTMFRRSDSGRTDPVPVPRLTQPPSISRPPYVADFSTTAARNAWSWTQAFNRESQESGFGENSEELSNSMLRNTNLGFLDDFNIF